MDNKKNSGGNGKPLIKKLVGLVLHAIAPHTCAHCSVDLPFGKAALLCRDCQSRLEPIKQPFCQRCGTELPYGGAHCHFCAGSKADRFKCRVIRSAFSFNPELQSAIHSFKYRYKPDMAKYLAPFLHMAFLRAPELAGPDRLVPVPVHKKRLAERGFNQSQALARELSALTGIPAEDVLEKIIHTRPQAGLSRKERLANLENAFAVTGAVNGLDILLIDDVATTGSTLEQCAAALKKAGARKVRALTLAREMPPS